MPSRVMPFANGEFYHIFNRGVAQMPIYDDQIDFKRFKKTMFYYQFEGPKPRFSMFNPNVHVLKQEQSIIEIICYCLLPNHFHFLVRQVREWGITEFTGKVGNSYTKYYNTRHHRIGPIFQGEFKAVHIETTEQLVHLSRYIHLNPLVGFLTRDLRAYKWSSYPEYIGLTSEDICKKEIILAQFKSPEDYQQFVLDQKDYAKKLAIVKHQLLDYA